MTRSSFRLAATACLALLLPFSAMSQKAPAAEEPTVFGEQVDVRVVNLEVVVTDRQGNRVEALKPGDFSLRVDGKEVPVEYFSEVREGLSVAPAAEAGQTEASGGVQSLAPEGGVGTSYLVFVDDFFAIQAPRNEILKSLKEDLAKMGPNDRMAIVAYDGGRLAMLSNWSSSQAELGRAFDQAMARRARGLDRAIERRNFRNDRDFASQVVGDSSPLDLNVRAGSIDERSRAYGETLIDQVKAAAGAAVSAMRGFAGPEGRKVMILLAGGWPLSVRSFITGGNGLPTQELPEGDKVLGPLTSTANLLGYTIYPVDVPGVQTPASDAEAAIPAAFSSVAEQEIEGSLHFIAKATGGQVALNSNRLRALARASADTRSYYWLGFSPSWQRNDKSHKVKVEVKRPGLEVRSRSDFLDLSRKAEVSMKVESALLFGNLPGAMPMSMKLGEPVRTKRGQVEIQVTLALPVDLMTVVPVGGKYAAQLELRFAASDADGNGAAIPVLPLDLKSDKPPTPGKFVRYETKLTLKGKADHMVVAVYDPLSGKVATAESDLTLP